MKTYLNPKITQWNHLFVKLDFHLSLITWRRKTLPRKFIMKRSSPNLTLISTLSRQSKTIQKREILLLRIQLPKMKLWSKIKDSNHQLKLRRWKVKVLLSKRRRYQWQLIFRRSRNKEMIPLLLTMSMKETWSMYFSMSLGKCKQRNLMIF